MINQIIDIFSNADKSIWTKYLVLKILIKYIKSLQRMIFFHVNSWFN